ncbi:hypothetical protein F2Q65_09470 [Thiohalocapsa marina]|uniref:Translation initiation factor IF-2 n=1 Tax=Thiohalocapsa marina TaxID=424902 RepID=A0A5M8FK94_9GAMM|nr:hypothetical protein [Thiohalocapsa marina]KAA6185318.1 hypothetical protein F2Q65_09470 [Thiohalocapsa marina]
MMKLATRPGLLIALLCPIGLLAAEVPVSDDLGLDLRLLQEDLPSGHWKPASSAPEDRLPSLGTQPMQGDGRPGGSRGDGGGGRGGFRSDLPYGAGYEARQGAGSGPASGSGSGPGRGGRGMGGGRRH